MNASAEHSAFGRVSRPWPLILNESHLLNLASRPCATLVAFTIDDCAACQFLLSALELSTLRLFGVDPMLRAFSELNPSDASEMDRLHLSAFPHMRLFRNGVMLSACEGVFKDRDATATRDFVRNWLSKHLARAPHRNILRPQ